MHFKMSETFNDHNDPDYNEFHSSSSVDRSKLKQESSKNETIYKIENILEAQFDAEIEAKNHEVILIDKRIRQTKAMLDRLRAYVVASYYGSGQTLIPMSKSEGVKKRKHQETKEKTSSDDVIIGVKRTFDEKLTSGEIKDSSLNRKTEGSGVPKETSAEEVHANETTSVNRFYITKEVIVGNVSKYLVSDNRKEKDKSTHKWMVYVRGPEHEPDISHYVKSVWFFLHPSYIPNDIVQVHKPPFQITRRGWGEFPIRVQLHFRDSRNKRFDIIHNLKLDKTYTGLQTLGAETVVKLELCRHTKDGGIFSKDQLFPVTVNTQTETGFCKTQADTNDMEKKEIKATITENVENDISDAADEPSENVPAKTLYANLKQMENVLSVVSSCVNSAAPSRCNSPVDFRTNCSITNDEINTILHELVLDATLIEPNADVRLQPFSCKTLDLYKQWSFSKRRAGEWQRSVFLKNLFIEYIDAYDKILDVPTTKQLMLWCRQNGYTPPELNLKVFTFKDNVSCCQFCGSILNQNSEEKEQNWCSKCLLVKDKQNSMITLSLNTNAVEEIKQKEKTLLSLQKLEEQNNLNFESDVDIDVTRNCETKRIMEDNQTELIDLSSTDELDWIYDTASDIGIHLPAVSLNGVRAPVLQMMLLSAMKTFVSDLLRKSNSEAVSSNKNTLQPALVTFNHVSNAICKTVKFDFLTDAHLGNSSK